MATDTLGLNDAQRRAIGVRLESMRRLIAELRVAGFESERLTELEEAITEFASESQAIAPEAPRSFVQATLAQLWVRAMEMRPRQLKQYGKLDEQTTAFLDAQSKRLDELVTQLVDDHERRRDAV